MRHTAPILLYDVRIDGKRADIEIAEGKIASIRDHSTEAFEESAVGIVDCKGMDIYPGLRNMHSHAPMVLFRGLGDDQPLQVWLNDYIWPAEQQLDDEKVYRGTLQACNEMLASGTTFFNDMYFRLPAMARAVVESGISARLGLNVFGDATELEEKSTLQMLAAGSERVEYSVAPHSVYTVSPIGLKRAARTCKELGLKMHIHMSETEKEVDDCLRQYGCRPWQLLHQLGILDLLGQDIIAAHCLHLSADEVALIGDHGITCVHCPNSNLKLGSGYRFEMQELIDAGATVALGTDGAASSNNLDMVEVMKVSSLLQKGWRQDPTAAPASQMLNMATGGSRIVQGAKADLFLCPTGGTSNLVYATHGERVAMTMVGGEIVYRALNTIA